MKYMGIDCGSKSAIACMSYKKIDQVLSINLGHKAHSDKKFLSYYEWVSDALAMYRPEVVYTEEIFLGAGKMKAAMSLYGKVGIIRLCCEAANVPLVLIKPSVVKKAIADSGRAEKIDVANGLIGKVTNNMLVIQLIGAKKFDETDAIAIALTGYQTGGL